MSRIPDAVAEDADGVDAVAVPVAGDGDVALRAVLEHVVDHVGAHLAGVALLHASDSRRPRRPGRAARSSGGSWRRVLRVGQARLDRHRLRVADPRRTEDADVGLAVAVPVAGDRLVALLAQLDPQVALVPNAVAVEVEEPQAVDEHADLRRAAAVPVAGDGRGAGHAEVDRLDRRAVLRRPGSTAIGPGRRRSRRPDRSTRRSRYWAKSLAGGVVARLAGVDHAQVPGSIRPARRRRRTSAASRSSGGETSTACRDGLVFDERQRHAAAARAASAAGGGVGGGSRRVVRRRYAASGSVPR